MSHWGGDGKKGEDGNSCGNESGGVICIGCEVEER